MKKMLKIIKKTFKIKKLEKIDGKIKISFLNNMEMQETILKLLSIYQKR